MKLICFVIGLFLLEIDSIISSSDIKSSLTFVIDDTGSMEDDIYEVKMGAKAIFDTVMNSNSSQVEDYVLVTINDPNCELRKATKDADEFKGVLDNLNIKSGSGNDDCPEMSMSGIELALQSSRDGSTLYVFTDASAKDFQKYDQVEALSQKMGCQIIFVLTGSCRVTGGRTGPQYLVYQRLAQATNGQVFHLEKYEVGKILEYVKYNIKSRKNILTSKTFPNGRGTFDINVDADTKELVISVSGKTPSVTVTDSGGTKIPTTDLTRLKEVAMVKVVGVKPDVYKVEVGGDGETHVVVSGSTSVHFQHGFSTVAPSAITETVRRPVPGGKSYLSIKLATEEEMELRSVQILDMNDTVVLEKQLTLVDKVEQFYTTEQIVPPDQMFKIAIKVYDVNSKTYLTRISLTPVKPQVFNMDTAKTKAPVVECMTNVIATYDKPQLLKCKISGYPKPLVTWESSDKSAVFSHFESTVELPYDFISVLNISNVKNNATYSCKAVNSAGDGNKSVNVVTKILNYFRALEVPKDKTIEYQKSDQIPCKVEAYPPATITWYRGGRLLRMNENYELAADRSVLFIRSMEPYMEDNYECVAVNSENREAFRFRVGISGVAAPVLNKQISSITAVIGFSADIQCRITKGSPTPTFHWKHKGFVSAFQFTYIRGVTDTIHFDKVEAANAGTYRCSAENIVGSDNHEIELIVECVPSISNRFDPNVTVNQGDMVTLPCRANGVPDPTIVWKFDGNPIRRNARHSISTDGTLRFLATSSDKGEYECEAKNSHGVDKINILLIINVPVDIESPNNGVIKLMEGLPLNLPCRADGSPKPSISWYYHNKESKIGPIKYEPRDDTGRLHFDSLRLSQSGEYTCVATNSRGSKNITYDVSVLAVPSIQATKKEFQGVFNDMQIQIPCHVTGNPKPVITWSFESLPIASSSDWYIGGDGTLTIKNINKLSEGVYECKASNKYGETKEDFNVIFRESPDPGFISNVIELKEGDSVIVSCSVLKKETDRLQWFKDGHVVSSTALELHNVTEADAGTYTCRVSSIDRPAQDASTKVEVGFKPRFTRNNGRNIPFVAGVKAVMDCTARGIPEPEVKWYHDGEQINFNDYKYELQMKDGKDAGTYKCAVSNHHGIVQQEFVVSSFECIINVKNDYNGSFAPLLLIPSEKLTNFDTTDGFVYIPKGESIKLVCPLSFITIPAREIDFTCENEQRFLHQASGRQYEYTDLKCSHKWRPSVKETGQRCKGNAEISAVGFEINGKLKEVYQVCLDKVSKNPIYTKLNMQPVLVDFAVSNNINWFNNGTPVNLDGLYDCNSQNDQITTILKREFQRDGCCFKRGMLVNPADIAPGLAQVTTYTHVNVAPQWSTCNSQNWEVVERRIRDLVAKVNRPLLVWTGTAENLQLPDVRSENKSIVLNNGGNSVQVPRYFWKVVQDSLSSASLAIIQVNVPDLRVEEVIPRYLRCSDVCKDTTWMRAGSWRNATFGFTYCCKLEDFERAFGYDGEFPRYYRLLSDVIPKT